MLKVNSVAFSGLITTSGTYCQLTCALPPLGPSGVAEGLEVFDSGSYQIITASGVSAGSVSIALLRYSPSGALVWDTATTPNSATGAAFILLAALAASTIYNGSLGVSGGVFFPCLGMRLIIAGLTGGNITAAQLILTKR
jgi:hypothetical protein